MSKCLVAPRTARSAHFSASASGTSSWVSTTIASRWMRAARAETSSAAGTEEARGRARTRGQDFIEPFSWSRAIWGALRAPQAPPAATLHRKPQVGPAARPGMPVVESEDAAVGLGDLAAQDEADAGALRLGREERHEEVRGVGQPRPVVVDPQIERAAAVG